MRDNGRFQCRVFERTPVNRIKKFYCIILQSLKKKISKTVLAVKEKSSTERDVYGLEGFNKQAER